MGCERAGPVRELPRCRWVISIIVMLNGCVERNYSSLVLVLVCDFVWLLTGRGNGEGEQ